MVLPLVLFLIALGLWVSYTNFSKQQHKTRQLPQKQRRHQVTEK